MELEIQKILKMAGAQYLKESTRFFTTLYINGQYQGKEINNTIIADLLDISTIKASKILSSLARVDLIEKAPKENTYFLHSPEKLYQTCLNKLASTWKDDIQAVNTVFSKNAFPVIVEQVDPFSLYARWRDALKLTSLQNNIYFEINSGGPACCIPFNQLDNKLQELLGKYFSKMAYDAFHERYLTLKWRLEEQKKRGIEQGSVYYIICPSAAKSHIVNFYEIEGPSVFHSYVILLSNLKHAFHELQEFMLNGQLQIIIDLNHKKINGPLSIHENDVYLCFIENMKAAGNYRVIHFNDARLSRIFEKSFQDLFNNMMRQDGYEKPLSLPNFIEKRERGQWLYESQLKKIENEIENVKKTYLENDQA
ncbi:MAG: hypothetical protein ACXQS8_00140 [Candidatus Helarchaeales archaeon]